MKKSALVLAFVLLLVGVNIAYAQDPPMGGGMMGEGMMGEGMMHSDHLWKGLKGLGLDEKQRETAKGIIRKTMKDVIKKRADIQIARIDLKDALDEDSLNMKVVESKLRTIEALETDIHLNHIKAIEEIKSILTPDQRKKLKDVMAEHHMKKGMGMMQGKGCGMMGGMSGHGKMETEPSPAAGDDKPEMEHAH